MKKKIYFSIVHISAVIGLSFLTDWTLKQTGVIDRKYTVSIGERVSVKFSDIDDYLEIYNYDGAPFLDKAIAIFVDEEIISITKIQNTSRGEKGTEMIFTTYLEDMTITVVHQDRDGIPSYRYVRGADSSPRKEYLSEIVWSTEPVDRREEIVAGTAE